MNAITLQNFDLDHAVFIQNEQIKTSSLKVAEYFGKQHKDVLRKIESLDCSATFTSAHFCAHVQTVEIGQGATRESKYYEMTKNGFIFLVMGFTGKKAAQIKEAYINAFDKMSSMLYNLHHNPDQMHVGAKVQLNSGSPLFTITKFNSDEQGFIKDADIMWYSRNKIHKETLPLQCLTIDQTNLIRSQLLDDFWSKIYQFGLDKLNHSDKSQTIALNLNQVYQCIESLPMKSQLTAAFMSGSVHHPRFIYGNHAVNSHLSKKTVKCWIFNTSNTVIEHKDTSHDE